LLQPLKEELPILVLMEYGPLVTPPRGNVVDAAWNEYSERTTHLESLEPVASDEQGSRPRVTLSSQIRLEAKPFT
jgi:hypothetical protein